MLVAPSLVYAAGGVGGGGSGSGGSGGTGNYTYYGWGWAQYATSGNGPNDGFRDGTTSWSSGPNSIKNTCQSANATVVDVFIVNDSGGSGMGYNYQNEYDGLAGQFSPGTSVDHGRGTAMSTGDARSDFNGLGAKGVSTSGFTFGTNVAWFCANPTGSTHPPKGGLALHCPNGYTVNGSDADDPGSDVSFQIRYDNSAGGIKLSGTTHDGDTSTRAGTFTKGRTYVLMIRDDDGSYDQVDSAVGPNCGGGGGGGTTTASSGCSETDASDTGSRTVGATETLPPAPDGTSWSTDNFGSSVITHTAVNVTDSVGTALVSNGMVGSGYAASDTWSYTPQGRTVTADIQQREHLLAHNGNWYWATYATTGSGTYTCYAATCSLDSVVGDLPGGVKAGDSFTVTVHLQNTGPLPLYPNLDGYGLSITTDGGVPHYYGTEIDSGDGVDIPITLTAGDTGSPYTYSVTPYPDYFGDTDMVGFGGNCGTASINVYEHFTLGGSAQATPLDSSGNVNTEHPDHIANTACVTEGGPSPNVGEHVTAETYEIPTGSSAHIAQGSPSSTSNDGLFATGAQACLYNNTAYDITDPIMGGQQYCVELDIPYTAGWVGPGWTDIEEGTAGSPDTSCPVLVNRPFFKVYNSAISAGGYSPTSSGFCSLSAGGNIGGWNNNSGTYPPLTNFGAGTPLSALASGQVVGFASGQTPASQTAYSRSPTDLTFANQGPGVNTTGSSTEGRSYSPYLGGNYGGSTHCLPDVAPPSGVTPAAGPVTIPATNVTGSTSVFVTGDVYITGNITYQGSGGGWSVTSNSSNVPSFVVHATGNIYISPGVTELDGLYVSHNKIYTCVPTGVSAPLPASYITSIYTNGCNQQLTVYGSFIADQVAMMRTFGSLRDETPTGPGTPATALTCSQDGGRSSPRPTCAAEVFDFSPDLYLSTPAIKPPSNGALQVDAITSLPPVL